MEIIRTYNIKVPEIENNHIKRVLSMLRVNSKPSYVDIIPESDAEIDSCFDNVSRKVEKSKGEIVYGWQLWEHSYMIEAEFHAVWKSPKNELVDITTKMDSTINKILFVVDETKKYDGKQTDNVRINTTSNELIDDIIEIEKTRYRFINKGERADIIGEIHLEGVELQIWEGINTLAFFLDEMNKRNLTINSKCFCNSGFQYKNCHRQYVIAMKHYK